MTAAFRDYSIEQNGVYHFYDLNPGILPQTPSEVIQQLPGPSVLHINGRTDGCRVITALIHGDSANSLRALLATLKDGGAPATNVKVIIVSVDAAKLTPVFSHSYLPGQRDLNRCFREPFLYQSDHLANRLLNYLETWRPESVVDIHDTLAMTHAFAISVCENHAHKVLASYFTDLLIFSPISIGALTDLNIGCPIISVHAPSDYAGIQQCNLYKNLMRFWQTDVLQLQQEVSVLSQPRRLELRRSAAPTFSDKPVFGVNCTLRQDIENCSFTVQHPGDVLGWVDHNKLAHFRVVGRTPREKVSDFFCADDNSLTVAQPMKLFVLGKSTDLAKSNCLFYFSTGS